MKTYTDEQVRKKLKKHVDSFDTAAAAAEAASCTRAELSIAMNGGRVPGKVLKAIGLQKMEVYADDRG